MKIISILIPLAVLLLAMTIMGCEKGVNQQGLSTPEIDSAPDTSTVDNVDVSGSTENLASDTTTIGQLEVPTMDDAPDTSSLDDISVDTQTLN